MRNITKRSWKKKGIEGFTLVEIVIVIAILAILSMLLTPRILSFVYEAEKKREINDARMLASEVTTFNAIALLDGTATIPNPLPDPAALPYPKELTKAMLDFTSLALPDEDSFPDNGIVKIIIDSEGNATIVY